LDAPGNGFCSTAPRISGSRRRENVVDIHSSDQRREYRNLLLRYYEIKARTPRRDVDLLRVEVSALPSIFQHYRAAFSAELCQLRSMLIVDVAHDCARRIRSASFKQDSFGSEVFIHSLVVIEMV